MRDHLRWWLLLLCLWSLLAQAADVTATINRDQVQLGDTVTLNLRVDGSAMGVDAPDLSPLQQDFQVLGSSRNSSYSLVNGKASASLTIGIALRPKHEGVLTIPSIRVAGGQSQPLRITVTAPDPAVSQAGQGPVFMQAELKPKTAWVGQQLSYVVRLYYAVDLMGPDLDTPRADGAEIRQQGKDVQYTTQRHGQRYRVLERRYVVVPDRAGTLRVDPLGFQGQAVGGGDLGGFFGFGRPVTATAPAQQVEVEPVPADWGRQAWLPARDVQLQVSGWPTATQPARVGEPINLVMSLTAEALSGDSLPELSLPAIDGATVYPDQSQTATTPGDPWPRGERTRSFALVPTRAGTLHVPATSVSWWNVREGRKEVASIPARDITVLPALGTAGGTSTAPAPATSAAAAGEPMATASAPASAAASSASPPPSPSSTWWRALALAGLLLWLLTLLGWWLGARRRRRVTTTAPAAGVPSAGNVRACRKAFFEAAKGSDSAAQLQTLLAWARAERPAIRQPGQLQEALDAADQRQAIDN